MTNLTYDATCVTTAYVEGGVHYREKAYTLIEAMFPLGVGTWSNKNSFYLRAPQDEFAAWEPVLMFMRDSGQQNYQWQAMEVVNQEFLSQAFLNAQQADQWRAQRALQVQRHLQDEAARMLEHKRRMYAEARESSYLSLMGQQAYQNPYTRGVDYGSNQWRYRWVSPSGDEFYTNDEFCNPNDTSEMRRSDWARTAVHPRL
jgi:hypothetical protein